MQLFYDIKLELDLLWSKPPKTFSEKNSHLPHMTECEIGVSYISERFLWPQRRLHCLLTHCWPLPVKWSNSTACFSFCCVCSLYLATITQEHFSISPTTPFGWFVALFSLLQSDGWWWDSDALEGFYLTVARRLKDIFFNNKWED